MWASWIGTALILRGKTAFRSSSRGMVSGLFEVNNGLKGQLKLLSMESGDGQTLEEATPQIERILREPKLQERFREYSEQLRKRAVVEIRQ